MKYSFTLFLLLIGNLLLTAQSTSEYSVRFLIKSDPRACVLLVNLEVKANEGQPLYYIADQNYRFSFDDNIVTNPRIFQELEISGNTFTPEYSAFFNAHHLNGSVDTIVSYNVELSGGSGYPVDDSRWYPVGCIAFDMVTDTACLNLKWHTQDPNDFPPTTINEKVGGESGTLIVLDEGTYSVGLLGCSTCDPLPIELANFEAVDQDCKTEIRWTTQTETNNDHFYVEKSADASRWKSIGKIAGAGNSFDPIDYIFYDEQVDALNNYYRLRQVDFDGQSTTTEAVLVRASCYTDQIASGITSLFPNPATDDDRLTLQFYTTIEQSADMVITDELGRVVKQISQDLLIGSNVLSFKVNDLTPGVYTVQIKGNDWYSGVQKFVKM